VLLPLLLVAISPPTVIGIHPDDPNDPRENCRHVCDDEEQMCMKECFLDNPQPNQRDAFVRCVNRQCEFVQAQCYAGCDKRCGNPDSWPKICASGSGRSALQLTGDYCDEDDDCRSGVCAGYVCRDGELENGQECNDNAHCLSGACYKKHCRAKAETGGGRCQHNDHCLSGVCVLTRCRAERLDDGERCNDDNDWYV